LPEVKDTVEAGVALKGVAPLGLLDAGDVDEAPFMLDAEDAGAKDVDEAPFGLDTGGSGVSNTAFDKAVRASVYSEVAAVICVLTLLTICVIN